jgi:eukaryotic-like serine/threonine-protein kinase
MTLSIGQIIEGKYRIVRVLGVGGMGSVYEGENTRIHRRVAIKVLHAAVAQKSDFVQRFEREAQAAGRIGSQHIVEVLDLGNLPSGERFMVMEYLDGEPLTNRIKRKGRLGTQECAHLTAQLLNGLAAAHQAGIIHRDLKPDNIFIVQRGGADFVKIVDFGVSKFTNSGDELSMTRTGAVMGTPYYMSPEQARGQPIDHRSDVYSVGVVCYQALTGQLPFNAETFNELLFKIALETPEPIEKIIQGVEPALAAIIRRSMERDAAHRFQSAAEFGAALGAFLSGAVPSPGAYSPAFDPRVTGQNPLLGQSGGGPLAQSGGGPLAHSGAGALGQSGASALGQSGLNQSGLNQSGLNQSSMGQGLAVTAPQPKKGNVMVIAASLMAVLGAGGGVLAYSMTKSPEPSAAAPVATGAPSDQVPTSAPTSAPTSVATSAPTNAPTSAPTTSAAAATATPSEVPTSTPTVAPKTSNGPGPKTTSTAKAEPTATTKPTSGGGRVIDGSL